MRIRNYWGLFFVVLIAVSFLNIGLVRKKSSGVPKAQTDSILYNKKMEEIKDGVKGAPTPSYEYYIEEEFLAEPPVDKEDRETEETQKSEIPELGAPIPEDLTGIEEEELDDDWWFEEWDQEEI